MSEYSGKHVERATFDLSQVPFREGDREELDTHLQGRPPEEIALVQNALQELIASHPQVVGSKTVIAGEDRFIFLRDASSREITVFVEEVPFTEEREIGGFVLRVSYEPGSGHGYYIFINEINSSLAQGQIVHLNQKKAGAKNIYQVACEIAAAGSETKESLAEKIRNTIASLK